MPRWPPIAAFRPVKAAASWLVWQRGEPVPGGAGAPAVPGWIVATGAALAVAPLVAAGAGELAAARCSGGLALEQAEARATKQEATASTVRPRTGDLR
jgi:hypothetical protein